MIPDIFINFAYFFISFFINLLPNGVAFPSEVHESALLLGGYNDLFSPIIPFTTLATVVPIALSIRFGYWIFRSIKWIISHIPLVGGKG